jgi:hypothetical protein
MKEKRCFKCGAVKPLSEFYKHNQMSDGHVNKCKDCNKFDVQQNYAKRSAYYKEYDQRRQRYSIARRKSHTYNAIKARSEGRGSHGYSANGMPYLSRGEFYEWFDKHISEYMELFKVWEINNFAKKYTPSVDRIDNKVGYIASNLQWLSVSDNTKKGRR